MKRAFISPSEGEITVVVTKVPRTEIMLSLALGMPSAPVYSIRIPYDGTDASDVKILYEEGFSALLDEVTAHLFSQGVGHDVLVQLYAQGLAAVAALENTPIKDDGTSVMLEVKFPLDQTFVDAINKFVVTAAPKNPRQWAINMPSKKPLTDAQRMIRERRDRALRNHPGPIFTVVYNIQGKPVGVVELNKNQIRKKR